MELQNRYADITRQGLGLIAISYDAPETLRKFADSRGITFPMISDTGSAIIRNYGLLNDTVDPKARSYGVPHPGTFIVDRKGVVLSRFFEDAYQERYTAATILSTLGAGIDGGAMSADTMHVTMTAAISDAVAAPGERLAITIDVMPKPGMHLYAPGKHDYQVVQLTLDPQPWLRPQPTIYPASEIYHFKPLDERVAVFMKPFRLRRRADPAGDARGAEVARRVDVADHHRSAGVSGLRRQSVLQPDPCADQLCPVAQRTRPQATRLTRLDAAIGVRTPQ